jgi:hypothetical protein
VDRLKERLEVAGKALTVNRDASIQRFEYTYEGGATLSQEPRKTRIGFALIGHPRLFSIRGSE